MSTGPEKLSYKSNKDSIMQINSKLLNELIESLQTLRDLDLENQASKDVSLESVKLIHEQVKLTQKLTSAFQQDISPFQKSINRKRINLLKKKGRDPDNLTKAELLLKVAELQKRLDPSPKENQ
jgi:hypothetical protein